MDWHDLRSGSSLFSFIRYGYRRFSCSSLIHCGCFVDAERFWFFLFWLVFEKKESGRRGKKESFGRGCIVIRTLYSCMDLSECFIQVEWMADRVCKRKLVLFFLVFYLVVLSREPNRGVSESVEILNFRKGRGWLKCNWWCILVLFLDLDFEWVIGSGYALEL